MTGGPRHAAWSLPPDGRYISAFEGIDLIQVPAFADNYLYLLHHTASGCCAAVDPGDARAIEQALPAVDGKLTDIYLTHHHGDHVGGVEALVARHGCRVTGNVSDASRLPCLTETVGAGDTLQFCGLELKVMSAPGHTIGHVLYVASRANWLFCGDTLFGMGCGRLFEGTAGQMFRTLQAIKRLPETTLICCAHEYTARNAAFARQAIPGNTAIAARAEAVERLAMQGVPTVPSQLSEELRTNPFLLAREAAEFASLRRLRDRF